MAEFLQITPRGDELPYFIRLDSVVQREGRDVICGAVYDDNGTELTPSAEVERRSARKICRAIMQELPSGRTVLVPVGRK